MKFFEVSEVEKIITFIQPIAIEVMAKWGMANKINEELIKIEEAPESIKPQIEELKEQKEIALDTILMRIEELLKEISRLGCELKDMSEGLVHFPSKKDDRMINICWRPEKTLTWCEIFEGPNEEKILAISPRQAAKSVV